MRRSILKEFEIDSVEAINGKEEAMWAYLTQEWLVLKSPRLENVTRWPLKRKWKVVQNADMIQSISPLVRRKVVEGNMTRLLNQAAGLVVSIAASGNYSSIDTTMQILGGWTEGKLRRKNISFEGEKENRKNRFLR